MCGIVGIARLSDRPLPPRAVLEAMRAALGHRGPDEVGAHQDAWVALGATRLAIRDPAGGHQPAHGCRRELHVVFNGELYAPERLRAALTSSGHALADHSDTTLLPHLYEEHGADLLTQLRGMFALAAWDPSARRLLLGRDRFGIKPLYYVEAEGLLLFASEQKALFASGLVRPNIDRRALDDLFSLTYPCPPRTMFEGVRELRPGHLLEVEVGRALPAPRRWYRVRFPPNGAHLGGPRRALEAELRERLTTVVGEHLVSDVPVGTYLSGGLDSSAITALATQVRGTPLHTFSLTFADPRFDEGAHAQAMAAALGSTHEALVLDASAADLYPEVVRALELPLHVPGAIGGLVLAKAARARGVPVILTGDGADELFGGYDCFRGDALRRAFDVPVGRQLLPLLYRTLYRWAKLPEGAMDWLLEVQRRPHAQIVRDFGGLRPPWWETWQAYADRERLLGLGGHTPRPAEQPPEELLALVPDDVEHLHPLDAALAFELETRLPAWILVISDRASMAHGVEARVPFLDHELVDWIASLPPALKLRGLTEKSGLRGAMRGVLPESIRSRKKRPFVTPVRDWFFGDRPPEWVEAQLAPRAVREAGLFDPAAVADLRRGLAEAKRGHFEETRRELTLMLVLGTQLLHDQLVKR